MTVLIRDRNRHIRSAWNECLAVDTELRQFRLEGTRLEIQDFRRTLRAIDFATCCAECSDEEVAYAVAEGTRREIWSMIANSGLALPGQVSRCFNVRAAHGGQLKCPAFGQDKGALDHVA